MQFSQADASKQNKNVEIETRSFLRTQLFCLRPILFRSESQKRHLQKKIINWYIVILCENCKTQTIAGTYSPMLSSLASGCVAPHILRDIPRFVSIPQKGVLPSNIKFAHSNPSEKCETIELILYIPPGFACIKNIEAHQIHCIFGIRSIVVDCFHSEMIPAILGWIVWTPLTHF